MHTRITQVPVLMFLVQGLELAKGCKSTSWRIRFTLGLASLRLAQVCTRTIFYVAYLEFCMPVGEFVLPSAWLHSGSRRCVLELYMIVCCDIFKYILKYPQYALRLDCFFLSGSHRWVSTSYIWCKLIQLIILQTIQMTLMVKTLRVPVVHAN